MYVDVHCHLDDKAFADTLPQVIEAAKAAGLKAIISNGTNLASNEAVKAICERYPLVRPAYGLYPTEPAGDDAAVVQWIRDQARGSHPPVAIGEIGLDGVQPVTGEQRERFRAMCGLANELGVPVIIHSRKAEQEVFDELQLLSLHVPIVMHCFGGGKKLVQEGVKRGYLFSIPASSTRSHHFQMIADMVPLKQLLTETDAPYLSPEKETFPNDPSSVVKTIEVIASVKDLAADECAKLLFMNYQRVFI